MTRPVVGPVADLVDPYLTHENKHIGRQRSSTPATTAAIWWIRRNPGRWALVAEGSTGLTRTLLSDCPDIEVTESKGYAKNPDGISRTYARVPHPDGESLKSALARRQLNTPALYLPDLTKDEFGWTKAELIEACKTARENLFPTGAP